MSLAYQIATSLNLNRPWQLAAAESITARPAPPPLPPDEGTTDSPGSVHSEGGVPPTEGCAAGPTTTGRGRDPDPGINRSKCYWEPAASCRDCCYHLQGDGRVAGGI